ncbi:class I SAM-dependent methyltransferase [Lysobacter korlensis]|uniref:Class I SAM-dependent methyltransferase n=1 Tax=Lysobacter korlensis TaxID=553636 RepID=A0ABV6RZD1_9GAMM
MAGDHYFSASPESDFTVRSVTVRLAGAERTITTAGGVFSPERLDAGTQVLLDTVPAPPDGGDLLDLGCGWGPVALSLGLESPEATVWAVDVNQRALELVRRNASALGLTNVNATLPDGIPEHLRFATIWSNPPIRVGKAELHALLLRWLPRLEPGASAWFVVQRNLGSDSLHRWMQDELPEGFAVERAASAKGYRVLEVRTPAE